MHLKSLYLRNFRNCSEAEFSFSPQINVLHGENGRGKTNILEAVYLIATGRSFRAEELGDLIQQGKSFFFLEAKVEKERFEHTIQVSYDGKTKKLQLDNNSYSTLQHLIGLLPSILFSPSDKDLIDGSPAIRRRFLNLHLAQSDPLYLHHLSRYWKAMKQRNTLLKLKQVESMDPWEAEMVRSASYLLEARQNLIRQILEPFQAKARLFSGKEESHEIRFHPSQPQDPRAYASQLAKQRSREMLLGATLSGPHRDDLSIWIDQKQASAFASEGQKKTAVAALRFAEWELLSRKAEGKVLFGIDDLGLHLDDQRQKLLRSQLTSLGQVFITTPHSPEQWPELSEAKSFSMNSL